MTAKAKVRVKNEYRRALLAKVHIAKKELCIDDDDYRSILFNEFRVVSAAELSNRELDDLLLYFRSKGWASMRGAGSKEQGAGSNIQTRSLKDKAKGLLDEAVNNGFVRHERGFVRSICGVDRLEWCNEAVRLKKLLAVLEKYLNSGA
jgi:phage gp16-like protein